MADQRITIKIAGHEYTLKVSDPSREEVIRKAADVISRKVASYQSSFAGKSETDILAFVALNECITNTLLNNQIDGMKQEAETLDRELGSYIEKIGK